MLKSISSLVAVLLIAGAAGAELSTTYAVYRIDDRTGAVSQVVRKADNQTVVTGFGNRYFLLSNSGDRKASERMDKVVKKYTDGDALVYECTNARLDGFKIEKRYFIVNDGLRRVMTFTNTRKEPQFLQLFTDSHFAPEFKRNGYYFGAGYLGPFIRIPKVSAPSRVESYVQSSKGMILVNPDRKSGSFAHLRVKLNDTVVFPWWQSTINSYREKSDRLYYLPDGWRMAMGTLDLAGKNGKFTYTDHFVFFPGDLFEFFDNVYCKDPDFAAAYAKIPAEYPGMLDVFVENNWGHEPYLKFLSEISDEGMIICKTMISTDWADYRWEDGFNGNAGGFITGDEVRTYINGMKAVTPRVKVGFHTITVAAAEHSPIFKEHPEYFRQFDRAGDKEIHFPGLLPNYQTMINRPEVRKYIIDSVCDMGKNFGTGFVYQDEAQYQNTINWQAGELIRDDHSVPVWDGIRRRVLANGQFVYFNGSGNPYADINYMECPNRMLQSSAWRDFAGVALGLEMVSKMRPGSRMALLYMNDFPNYFGRVLANGWVPVLGDIARNNPGSVTLMRAAYEMGKTLPQQVHYTPDWKRDPNTPWESYTVRRVDSNDTVISFINRTGKTADLPVAVDLGIAAYPAGTRLNIWAYRHRYPQGAALHYILSDKEIRTAYRQHGWFNLSSAVPELVYSGENKGVFKHTFKNIGKDDLVQYVIVPSPAVVYAVNDQPGTYMFTRRKGVEITGNKIVSSRDRVDILLAEKDMIFTDICLDGKPVTAQWCDINGLLMQKITVPAGTHTLSYKRLPRPAATAAAPLEIGRSGRQLTVKNDDGGLYVIEQNGFSCMTGRSPLLLPEYFQNGKYRIRRAGNLTGGAELTLTGGRNSAVQHRMNPYIAPKTVWQSVNLTRDGVTVHRAGSFISGHRELRNLQRNLPPVVAAADPENLTITAGTTRRNDTLDINHYGGFEFSGAECVQLKLTHNFLQAQSFFQAGSHVWLGGEKSKVDFSGIVVDYRVNGKYTKRVIFSWGIGTRYLENRFPEWGTGKKQDVYIRLGDFLERPETVFSLDLKKYAPANWDGTVILAAGNNHILANRMFKLAILKFNDRNTGDFVTGKNVGDPKQAGHIPAELHLPKLRQFPADLTETALGKWAKISSLQPYGATEELTQRTTGYLSYDDKALYVVMFAHETARAVQTPSKVSYANDCVDIFLETPNKKICQLCVDGKGRFVTLPEGSMQHVQVSCTPLAGGGYMVKATIPWADLNIKDAVPGVSLRANFCRSRIGKNGDRGAWGPVRSESGLGFRDVEKYGRITLGFPVSGMGRFDEVEI